MRTLLTALLIASAIASPPARSKQQSKPNEQSTTTADLPNQGSPVVVVVNQPPAPEKKESPTAKPRNGPPIWSNWALVIVALGAGILALRSLRLIGRQTKAAEDAAIAAKKSADGIINAERPWVLPVIKRETRNVPLETTDDDGNPLHRYGIYFSFYFVNKGRTPAHIITVTIDSVYTDAGEELPDIPDYGLASEFQQQRILEQGSEPWGLPEWEWEVKGVLFDDRLDDVRKGHQRWWRFGHIIYKNVLDGREHETRFCYLYRRPPFDDFIIAGPSQYTKYT